MQCIYNPSCGATDLVAAIKAAPSDLRDLIVGVVDVAQYGDVSLYDGNWSSQDVEAAANAEKLIAMGADPATAALIASVAGRLIGHGDQWETLDAKEQSWLERNGGNLLMGATLLAAGVAIIATSGAAIAGSGMFLGMTATTWGTVGTVATGAGIGLDVTGVGLACGLGYGDCSDAAVLAGLKVATLGLASGGKAAVTSSLTSGTRGVARTEMTLRAERLAATGSIGAGSYVLGLQATHWAEGSLP